MTKELKLKIEALEATLAFMPNSAEGVVINVMIGNLLCGVSNMPLADRACEIAREILKDIQT